MMAGVASSSSAALPLKKYDVFISFRGEDNRSNFTSHLHGALSCKNIQTFIDYRLDKGDEIWPALIKAIEESRVFIVVLSENYASSKWCLNELSEILECKEIGHIVLPVFYKTDPLHVRKQIGSYKEAFATHEKDLKNNKEMVQKWKAAFTEIANLAGWHSKAYRTEYELIDHIVKTILRKLKRMHPMELRKLVAIDKNNVCIESSLRIGSSKVQTIGIWGMGGIGKTTISAVAFAKLSSQFEGSCFLANIREESVKHGLNYLRNILLSELLEEDDLFIGTPLMETSFVMSRLRGKKVFIVLDDLNDSDQINYFIGDTDHLGPGSCVIITSRDKNVLISGQVDEIHEVIELTFQESLQLFCMNAFKKNHPDIGYEELSERVVGYAKGNPLASKILGLHFCSIRSTKIWESTLEKLKKYPNKQIQDVLKVSYDGLELVEKKIFLDIACFFRGNDKEHVERLLDACEFYAAAGIDTLQKRALITISYKNTIEMHDLIQEMGRGIVHQESLLDPGSCSRLWDPTEICDLLKSNKGTDKVEGIMLNMYQIRSDVHLKADTFKKMTNLRFLIFYIQKGVGCVDSLRDNVNMYLPTGLESLPDNLRYLEWNGYPLKSLPSTFCPEKLVEISMPFSNVQKLWEGVQNLVNLKEIDLSGSEHLIELPNFSLALNLERVLLDDCTSLCHVHPSILSLQSLVALFLNNCKSLKSLESVVHLRSLSDLRLWGCSSLMKFSVTSENMKYLDLYKMGIVELPSSIGCLSKLKELHIRNCFHLKNLPNELCGLTSLGSLYLSGCGQVDTTNLGTIVDSLRSLSDLNLRNCCNLYQVPDNIGLLSQLITLGLSGSNVETLPASIIHLSQLKYLYLSDCRRLRFVPELPPSLRCLSAAKCISLETVFINSSAGNQERYEQTVIWMENCVKLDEHSINTMLNRIKDGAIGEIVYPGRKVPNWFNYQTTQGALTIECCLTADLRGSIFCVILSQFLLNEEDGGAFKIGCKYYVGAGKEFRYTRWIQGHSSDFIDLKRTASGILDHVFVWYDDLYQSESDNMKVSFEFSVFSNKAVRVLIKRCGVQPIYNTDLDAGGMRVGRFALASADNKNEKELETPVYASFSSSATLPPKKYDVFISFRSGDNHNSFASNLHSALSHRKVKTYIDDRLHKGYEISPAVTQALKESHVLVVIFSKIYASSKWCLNELSKILESKELIVIPVFYEVHRFDVKYHYGKTFERQKQYFENNKEKVQKWRDDLKNTAILPGWKSPNYSATEQPEIIEMIVEDIMEKLNHMHPGELPADYCPSDDSKAWFESFVESEDMMEEAVAVPKEGCGVQPTYDTDLQDSVIEMRIGSSDSDSDDNKNEKELETDVFPPIQKSMFSALSTATSWKNQTKGLIDILPP